jgi:hypothetical protein
MTLEQELRWKLKLANAILAESEFSGCPITVGDKIESQLGTVWVGDKCAIATVKCED